MNNQNLSDVNLHYIPQREDLPPWVTFEQLVLFLHENMKPYEDTREDTQRGLEYAFSNTAEKSGFVLIAEQNQKMVGASVVLETGMGGYIPSNLLLFVAVDPLRRNQGIGGRLVKDAAMRCKGDIKIHVEYENPAKRLYERLGFKSKYAEMRYDKETT